MKITASEIYRLQKIADNVKMLITIWDELQREITDQYTEQKIQNIIDSTTKEFYLISETLNERK